MAIKTFTQSQLTASDLNTYTLKGDTCIASVPVTVGQINNCFSSTYQNYKIVVSNFFATGNCQLWMQLGYGGGSTWLATAYFQAGAQVAYSTGAITNFANNNTFTHFRICGGTTAATGFSNSAVINISRPFTASATEYSCATTLHQAAGTSSWQHAGKQTSVQSCDSIRWGTTASAVSSGIISVYGVAQA